MYTFSDVGVLSYLIGSLSRTIQHRSPSSEWIMCELGVFPFVSEKDLSNFDKVLKLMFLNSRQAKEGSKEFKAASIHLLQLMFLLHRMFTTHVYNTVNAFLLFCLYSLCNTKQRSNCSRPFTLTYCFRLAR